MTQTRQKQGRQAGYLLHGIRDDLRDGLGRVADAQADNLGVGLVGQVRVPPPSDLNPCTSHYGKPSGI